MLFLSSVLYLFIQATEKPVFLQNLSNEEWQFAASVERPSANSPLWKPVKIGQDLSTQKLLWGGYNHVFAGKYTGWYRLQFDKKLTKNSTQSFAFLFGKVQETDQVWLNGVYLGRYGIIDNKEQWHVSDLYQQRLYKIPDNLLKEKNNILYMQIQAVRTAGGIVSDPIGIAELNHALHYKYNIESDTTFLQTISLTLLLTGGFIALMLYVLTDLKDREHPLFIVLLFCLFIGYLYDSLLFSNSSWKTPFLYQLSVFISTSSFIVFMLYVLALVKSTLNRSHQFIIFYLLCYSLLAFIPMWTYTWIFSLLGLIGLVLFLPISLYQAVKTSVYNGERHLIPLVIGIVFWLMGILLSYFTLLWFNPHQYDVQFHEIGLIMLILGLMIGYVQRLIQLQFRFQALSLKLFAISEKERQHISRELHDSISQRLAALRLRMQMLALKHPDVDMQACSDDLLETMEEMGRILHGLRPLSLEKFGLIPAMQHEIDRVSESSDIPICFNADTVNISAKKEQHLFRIFQECLSNAVRHAKAETITVNLRVKGKKLSLSIIDDGIGWQKTSTSKKWGGLGKLTLQERLEMINANLVLDIKESKGTKVCIHLRCD